MIRSAVELANQTTPIDQQLCSAARYVPLARTLRSWEEVDSVIGGTINNSVVTDTAFHLCFHRLSLVLSPPLARAFTSFRLCDHLLSVLSPPFPCAFTAFLHDDRAFPCGAAHKCFVSKVQKRRYAAAAARSTWPPAAAVTARTARSAIAYFLDLPLPFL